MFHSSFLFQHYSLPPSPDASPLYSLFLLSPLCPLYLFYFLSVSGEQSPSLLLVPGPSRHCNQTPGISSGPTLAGRHDADKTLELLLRLLQCCSFGRNPLLPSESWILMGFAKEKQWEVQQGYRHPPGAKGWNTHWMATNGSSKWHTFCLRVCRWCLSTGSVAILERQ